MTDIVDELRSWPADSCWRMEDASALLRRAADEIERLRKIEVAARALDDFNRRSLNAGPITKYPRQEGALGAALHEALTVPKASTP